MLNVMDPYKKHKNLIDQLLIALPFDDHTRKIVAEYLDAVEYGIAFDQIVHDIFECRISLKAADYRQIEALAQLMKLPQEDYTFLEPQIIP